MKNVYKISGSILLIILAINISCIGQIVIPEPPGDSIKKELYCTPIPPDIVKNSDFSIFNHSSGYIDERLTYDNVCEWYPAFGTPGHLYPCGQNGITGGAMKMFLTTASDKGNQYHGQNRFPLYGGDTLAGFYQNTEIIAHQHFSFHLKYMCDWGNDNTPGHLGVKKLVICLTNDSVETLNGETYVLPFSSKQTILEFTNFSYTGWPIRDTSINFIADDNYKRIFIYSYITEFGQGEIQGHWIYEVNLVNLYPVYAKGGADTTISCNDSITLGGNPTAWGGIPFINDPHYKYSWSSIPPGFNSHESNPVVSPRENTTYIITVTDSIGLEATDTVVVNVNGCFTWPRQINHAVSEGSQFTCNSDGDLLAAISTWDTIVSFVDDTTIILPREWLTSLVFFDQYSNRYWYHALYTLKSCPVQQLLVDDQRNSYVLFDSPIGYSFLNGPSLTLQNWNYRQYLAKIDISGNVDWVQSFSTNLADTTFHYPTRGFPIESFCKVGDSIYLSGYAFSHFAYTEKVEFPLKKWSLGPNSSFICTLKCSSGEIDTITSFSFGDSLNYPTYITSLKEDTIVVVKDGIFYRFDLATNPIDSKIVFDSAQYYSGVFNNGENKIIVGPPSCRMSPISDRGVGCAEDSGGKFSALWVKSFPLDQIQYSGFATGDNLFLLEAESDYDRYISKIDIKNGNELERIPDSLSHDSLYYIYAITGNKDLSYGYSFIDLYHHPFANIKIDTFGITSGKLKKAEAISNPLSLNNNLKKTDISVFPNPVSDSYLTIQLSDLEDAINSIEIINSTGIHVKRIITNQPGYKVYFGDLPDGLYVVLVKTSSNLYKKKIIKF